MDGHHDRVTIHAALADAPDDAAVTGWASEVSDDPNVTYVDTVAELRALTAELNAQCQGQISTDYIEEQISHEAEHAAAARAVGFSKIRYGLGVWRKERLADGSREVTTNWQVLIVHVAPVKPVTKLSYAAIVAAPRRLSAGDAAGLREIGYRDAADVAGRIRSLASRTGLVLPMPVSVTGISGLGFPGGWEQQGLRSPITPGRRDAPAAGRNLGRKRGRSL